MKPFLLILGVVSAVLIVGQLVMGQLIAGGQANLIKWHQHSGYLTVVICLIYIGSSLSAIASQPKREK